MGEFEQQWFYRSVGINVCKSGVEALYCNMDNRVVSLLNSIDTITRSAQILFQKSSIAQVFYKYQMGQISYRLIEDLISLPRHHHPLQPRLPIIPARPLVENGDAKTPRALQCEQRKRNCKSKTSVSDGNRCRRCKKPGKYSTLRPHRSARRSHMRGQIAEPQPPIAFLLINSMRTKYEHAPAASTPFYDRHEP